jgi:hypothetical protein
LYRRRELLPPAHEQVAFGEQGGDLGDIGERRVRLLYAGKFPAASARWNRAPEWPSEVTNTRSHMSQGGYQ